MNSLFRYLVVCGLLLLAAIFVHRHQDITVPTNKPLAEIPTTLGGWRMISQDIFDERTLAVLKPTDYLSRVYGDDRGRRVSLYIGYHGGGPESGPIHSPKHCLPGSGWQVVDEKAEDLSVAGKKLALVSSVYQNGEQRSLFLYWFQVRGESMTSEYQLKFSEIKNSILYNRRDSAFIRVSLSFNGDVAPAKRLAQEFVREFYPYVDAVLPK